MTGSVCYNQTRLSEKIEITDIKAAYDENAKWLLAEKEILAYILLCTIPEYRDMRIDEIISLIEETPQVAEIPVAPGKSNNSSIIGDNVENTVPGEGSITYDIRFHAWLPQKQEQIKFLIDIEAQKNYYPGYDIVTRGVFYTARMISAQLGTEFEDSDYNNIKKVYSIWICMNVPKYAENTITEYSMIQKNIVGDFPIGKSRYDLQSVIIVGLSKKLSENKRANNIHRLLGAILSEELSVEEKKAVLENEYQIFMTQPADGRVIAMCNLSEAIEEKASMKALISIVRNMIKKDMSVESIIDLSGKEAMIIQRIYNLAIENEAADDDELTKIYMDDIVQYH